MGHAVYSLSDPRANVFKSFVESLSKEKGREDEFNLYSRVERLAPQVIASERKMYKGVSANVDFYSGSFTVCLTCRWNCIHLCSQSQELQVGRLTELRNLSIRVKSFVPHIKVSHLTKNMFLLTAEIKNKQSQCIALGLFNSCIKSISNVLKNQTL